MTASHVYHFLVQSYLNPVLFLGYLFGAKVFLAPFGIAAFRSTDINCERLIGRVYFAVAPIIYFCWMVVSCCFLNSLHSGLSLYSMLDVGFHWLQYGGFLITALALRVYLSESGMEGNVMGFIFGLPLLFGAAIHVYFHFRWIWLFVVDGGSA